MTTNPTEIAHEIISQAIMLRINKLQIKVEEIEETLHQGSIDHKLQWDYSAQNA